MHCLFRWLRNPVKALFVPITEAQMDELQGLSEQGSLNASVFVNTALQICHVGRNHQKILQIWLFDRAQIKITVYYTECFGDFQIYTPQTRQKSDKCVHQLWTREWVASNLMCSFNQKVVPKKLTEVGTKEVAKGLLCFGDGHSSCSLGVHVALGPKIVHHSCPFTSIENFVK